MTPLRTMLAVMMVIAGLLLAAGCVGSQPDAGNQTEPIPQTTTTSPMRESLVLYKVTIPQENPRADFIKMEADVYNVGEVVEFSMVYEGEGVLQCPNLDLTYRVFYIRENGTSVTKIPGGMVQPMISYHQPGEHRGPFRFATTGWEPGRYRIEFDCGGIYREFRLREIPKINDTQQLPGEGNAPVPSPSATMGTENRVDPVKTYQRTIPQPDDSRADYIKTEADIDNVGEVIEFYLVNNGADRIDCKDSYPLYRVFYYNGTGTATDHYPVVEGNVRPPSYAFEYGHRTSDYRVVTINWTPGRYRIQFDCGGAYRDFLLREVPKVNVT